MQRRRRTEVKASQKTVAEIRREIEEEREWTLLQQNSLSQWEAIVEDMSSTISEIDTDDDNEWKTRFYFQTLYNDMLKQQRLEMKSELRMMRHGHWSLRGGPDMSRMTEAECRRYIKTLELELKSLKGLCTTYERQLDEEAMAYNAAHSEAEAIMNDVWFREKTTILAQENIDRETLQFREDGKRRSLHMKYKKPVTLPPIQHTMHNERKASYFKMFEATRDKRKKPARKVQKKHVHFSHENEWIEDDWYSQYSDVDA